MRTAAEFERLAQLGVKAVEKRVEGYERGFSDDLHVVVIVTDARGEWCGVAGNVWPERVAAMLASAVEGDAS